MWASAIETFLEVFAFSVEKCSTVDATSFMFFQATFFLGVPESVTSEAPSRVWYQMSDRIDIVPQLYLCWREGDSECEDNSFFAAFMSKGIQYRDGLFFRIFHNIF